MGKKEGFQKRFREHYALRFHMMIILLATALSGTLFSKLLLVSHVRNFGIRYPVTVLLSYGVFFLCIRLWLLYVAPGRKSGSVSDGFSYVYVSGGGSGGSSGGGGSSVSSPRPGGGDFSGAGASASFDVRTQAAATVPLMAGEGPSEGSGIGDGVASAVSIGDSGTDSGSSGSSGSSSSGSSGSSGGGGSSDGMGAIIVVVVLVAVVAAVLGGAFYMIFQAPAILSEAAFQGLLAASLVKQSRNMDAENWMGSIFKATWKPFALTLVAAFVGGLVLHHYYPGAHRLMDVMKHF